MSQSTIFYNVRARLYACPQCGAKPGEKCFGAFKQPVGYTHVMRRRVAAEEANKERRK